MFSRNVLEETTYWQKGPNNRIRLFKAILKMNPPLLFKFFKIGPQESCYQLIELERFSRVKLGSHQCDNSYRLELTSNC